VIDRAVSCLFALQPPGPFPAAARDGRGAGLPLIIGISVGVSGGRPRAALPLPLVIGSSDGGAGSAGQGARRGQIPTGQGRRAAGKAGGGALMGAGSWMWRNGV
jgi:hypothetical protein